MSLVSAVRCGFIAPVCLVTAACVTSTPLSAQPLNRASAKISFIEGLSTQADFIPNAPALWNKSWHLEMLNLADAGAPTVVNPTIELVSADPLTGFFPSNLIVAHPVYRWNFLDLQVAGYPARHLPEDLFLAPSARPASNSQVDFPRVSFARSVTPILLADPQTDQMVTATLTIEEALSGTGPLVNSIFVSIGNVPTVYGAFTPVAHEIISYVPVSGWNVHIRGQTVVWSTDPDNLQVGQTLTFQCVLRSAKSPQLLGSPTFKPRTNVGYSRTQTLPSTPVGPVAVIEIPESSVKATFSTDSQVTWTRRIGMPRREIAHRQTLSQVTSEPPFRVIVPATVEIEPEVLNTKSKGVLTAFVVLPDPYALDDIDETTVRVETAMPTSVVRSANKLIVHCERELLDLPLGDNVEIGVSGLLRDGSLFVGSDIVRTK